MGDRSTGIWCVKCRHSIPTEVMKPPKPNVLCFGCTAQTEDERNSPKGHQWSYILNHWYAEAERVLDWLRDDFHSVKLLQCLCELARYYNYNDIVPMANSMALERIRHGTVPGIYVRHVVESDFFDALELAKNWQFRPIGAEAVSTLELMNLHLSIDKYGFIQDDFDSPRYIHSMGVCQAGRRCKNVLPLQDRIVTTYAYRQRKGCIMLMGPQ
ncbi:hypothetical protein K445DRAFT_304714 [Daldinia sp. EC12]|nr:hypothetical protein F4774DRAFT_425895 [Daldinia eschscholtzii]OTB13006.1 hypothetical protein K445DRAFT_304714 [Daldinia sp. EC12]